MRTRGFLFLFEEATHATRHDAAVVTRVIIPESARVTGMTGSMTKLNMGGIAFCQCHV